LSLVVLLLAIALLLGRNLVGTRAPRAVRRLANGPIRAHHMYGDA
jgi:hypothetical protein